MSPSPDYITGRQPGFAGRDLEVSIFREAIARLAGDGSLAHVFYGPGGIGKTALLQRFAEVTAQDGPGGYPHVRTGMIDLHGRRMDDADRLLVVIRNSFATAGIVFPRFDAALAIYWESARTEEAAPRLVKQWLKRSGEAGQDGMSEVISDVAGSIPGLGFAIKAILNWSIRKGTEVYLQACYPDLERMYVKENALRTPQELSSLLPWMLARDLRAHLERHPNERFLLLIDEYEAVYSQAGAGSVWSDHPFDTQLKTLVRESAGLLAFFFSRERLRWEWEPGWSLTQTALSGLDERDAEQLLLRVPVPDEDVREAILQGTRESGTKDDTIYPLLLRMQIDTYLRLAQAGKQITRETFRDPQNSASPRSEIVGRLLRSYDLPMQKTIERLSVASRFDRRAFEHVVRTFSTALPSDHYKQFVGLSFIQEVGDGFHAMHSVLREILRDQIDEESRASSAASLLAHFEHRLSETEARNITEVSAHELFEAAHLRLLLGNEGYVNWLAMISMKFLTAAWGSTLIPLWEEAEAVMGADPARTDLERAEICSHLSNLQLLQGDVEQCRDALRRALHFQGRALGVAHAKTLNTIQLLFDLVNTAQLQEVKQLSRPEAVPAAGHFECDIDGMMGAFLRGLKHINAGKMEQARADIETATSYLNELVSPDDELFGHCAYGFAIGHAHLRDDFRALELLDAARRAHAEVLGDVHPLTRLAQATCEIIEDMAAAEALLETKDPGFTGAYLGLVGLIQRMPAMPDHPTVAAALVGLGRLLAARAYVPAASELIGIGHAMQIRLFGANHAISRQTGIIFEPLKDVAMEIFIDVIRASLEQGNRQRAAMTGAQALWRRAPGPLDRLNWQHSRPQPPGQPRLAWLSDQSPHPASRNAPCPCGSGRRYKTCHGRSPA